MPAAKDARYYQGRARGGPVVFQYSIERSCRFSIVMIQESAEPLASDDPA